MKWLCAFLFVNTFVLVASKHIRAYVKTNLRLCQAAPKSSLCNITQKITRKKLSTFDESISFVQNLMDFYQTKVQNNTCLAKIEKFFCGIKFGKCDKGKETIMEEALNRICSDDALSSSHCPAVFIQGFQKKCDEYVQNATRYMSKENLYLSVNCTKKEKNSDNKFCPQILYKVPLKNEFNIVDIEKKFDTIAKTNISSECVKGAREAACAVIYPVCFKEDQIIGYTLHQEACEEKMKCLKNRTNGEFIKMCQELPLKTATRKVVPGEDVSAQPVEAGLHMISLSFAFLAFLFL